MISTLQICTPMKSQPISLMQVTQEKFEEHDKGTTAHCRNNTHAASIHGLKKRSFDNLPFTFFESQLGESHQVHDLP